MSTLAKPVRIRQSISLKELHSAWPSFEAPHAFSMAAHIVLSMQVSRRRFNEYCLKKVSAPQAPTCALSDSTSIRLQRCPYRNQLQNLIFYSHSYTDDKTNLLPRMQRAYHTYLITGRNDTRQYNHFATAPSAERRTKGKSSRTQRRSLRPRVCKQLDGHRRRLFGVVAA